MQALHRLVAPDHPRREVWRYWLTEGPSPAYAFPSAQSPLPEQIHDSTRLSGKYDGIVALMAAVLEDAVECFWKQFRSTRQRDLRLAREAEEWFLSENDASPFSFVNICMVLGVDPDYIRTGLKQQQFAATPITWSTLRQVRRR